MSRRESQRLGPWVRRLACTDDPAAALLCFPPAGGGASLFHRWLDHLPDGLDLLLVQPPGREDRHAELPRWVWPEAVSAVDRELSGYGIEPTVVFGHSLGGLVAARYLTVREEAGRAPTHLVISATTPDPERAAPVRSDIVVAQIIDAVGLTAGQWGALPAELRASITGRWLADADVQRDLLASTPVLRTPFTVWGGDDDRIDTVALERWRRVGPVAEVRMWPGGHRYPFDRPGPVVADLVDRAMAPEQA